MDLALGVGIQWALLPPSLGKAQGDPRHAGGRPEPLGLGAASLRLPVTAVSCQPGLTHGAHSRVSYGACSGSHHPLRQGFRVHRAYLR